MERTLNTVLEVWNENSLWGWDFAVMAMTAASLGKPAPPDKLSFTGVGRCTKTKKTLPREEECLQV